MKGENQQQTQHTRHRNVGDKRVLSTLHQNYSQANRKRKGLVYTIALHIKLTKISHSIKPWQ